MSDSTRVCTVVHTGPFQLFLLDPIGFVKYFSCCFAALSSVVLHDSIHAEVKMLSRVAVVLVCLRNVMLVS